jgi:hypothetical protein
MMPDTGFRMPDHARKRYELRVAVSLRSVGYNLYDSLKKR